MQAQNRQTKRPWAGVAALLLATALTGLLLARLDLQAVLHPWYLTRAAGLIAYLMLWAAATVGLLQSLGMLKGVTGPGANLDVHEHLSLWAIYATTFHAVILHWDRYVSFDWYELTIPFLSDYEPASVALGIGAFYLTVLVTVTTYLRSRLTPRVWRAIHLLSLPAFLFAIVHGVLLGTDADHPFVAYVYRFTAISAGLLVALRMLKGVRTWYANLAGRR
ncbi:MAG: ferric reductase-like transmembrane domain-containing protein [Bacillota bacterium]